MGVTLALVVYGSISILAGYLISLERAGQYRWIFIGWFALILPNFALGLPMVGLFVAAIILLMLPKKSRLDRAVLYVGLFSAVPGSLSFFVPFPGINYLIVLDYPKIAFLVLLLPIFLMSGRKRGNGVSKGVDQTVAVQLALFLLLATALSFRDLPFTSALRAGVNWLFIILPALAISFAVRTEEDIDRLLKSLMILAAIYAGVGIISQFIRWNIYSPHEFHDTRWGILRVSVTTVPTLAGVIAFAGLMIASHKVNATSYSKFRLLGFQALMLVLMFFTFARGAWVASLAGWMIFLLLSSRISNSSAIGLAVLGAVGGFIAGTSTLVNFDPYGTFSYRVELLKAAQKQFWEAPLFGSPNFLESGNFDHLWTGMGLIDVVNEYVALTMTYGAVGVLLYLAPFVTVMIGLLRYRVANPARSDRTQKRINKLVAIHWALLSSFIVLIMTLSSVSYITHYGYMILGMSLAAVKVAGAMAAANLETEGSMLVASDRQLSQ